MTRILALPVEGEVFLDTRDEGRWMRLSWHHEDELVVFSIWRAHTCVATFRLGSDDVPKLIESLVNGLAKGYHGHHTAGHLRPESVGHATSDSRPTSTLGRIVSGHPAARVIRRVPAYMRRRLPGLFKP
jgi:hypothetical protein